MVYCAPLHSRSIVIILYVYVRISQFALGISIICAAYHIERQS